MSTWLPWLKCSPEQRQQFKNIIFRFNINVSDSNSRDRCLQINRYYGLTSYTLQNAVNSFQSYLNANYYSWNDNNTDAEIAERKENGLFEFGILSFLATFSPEIRSIIQEAFTFCDRGNTERHDPIGPETPFKICYFPKGITGFNNIGKTFKDDISAKLQREIIKENSADTSLTDPNEKTITVKVFTDTVSDDEKYFHVYFNKKSDQTVRRIIYKSIREAIIYFDSINKIPDELDKDCFAKLFNAFFYQTETDFDEILNSMKEYIDKKMTQKEENLVKNFSEKKKKQMNSERKSTLENNLNYAKQNYERNMTEFSRLKNEYMQAKKAFDSFEEVEFDAIEIFLNKLKEHPGTKLFAKINDNTLQFLIEEPMIHTESEVWARLLSNTNSEINYSIQRFAQNHCNDYNTTCDILRYATQRLIKELFVDQKIRVYTAALLGLRSDRTDFLIEKYILPDSNYMPHPHIGTSALTCWSEAVREIGKQIMENNGETAFLQLTYALQQMTASDNVVSRKFVNIILNENYANQAFYIKKGQDERVSFKSIIKEFIDDETNKINAIIASESEGSTN